MLLATARCLQSLGTGATAATAAAAAAACACLHQRTGLQAVSSAPFRPFLGLTQAAGPGPNGQRPSYSSSSSSSSGGGGGGGDGSSSTNRAALMDAEASVLMSLANSGAGERGLLMNAYATTDSISLINSLPPALPTTTAPPTHASTAAPNPAAKYLVLDTYYTGGLITGWAEAKQLQYYGRLLPRGFLLNTVLQRYSYMGRSRRRGFEREATLVALYDRLYGSGTGIGAVGPVQWHTFGEVPTKEAQLICPTLEEQKASGCLVFRVTRWPRRREIFKLIRRLEGLEYCLFEEDYEAPAPYSYTTTDCQGGQFRIHGVWGEAG